MNSKTTDQQTKQRKAYKKPEMQKHRAVAVASGSSADPCVYKSKNFGNTYYH